MNLQITKALRALFEYADKGVYIQNNVHYDCPMWCDTGWLDAHPGYDSVAAETMTIISVLSELIPSPKAGDQVFLNHKNYMVDQIDAQDDYITNLIVRSL